jgi:uncharacterized protein YndB with AHSA1/START domain
MDAALRDGCADGGVRHSRSGAGSAALRPARSGGLGPARRDRLPSQVLRTPPSLALRQSASSAAAAHAPPRVLPVIGGACVRQPGRGKQRRRYFPRDTETIVDKMEVMTGGDWRFIHRNCGRSVPRHLSGGDAPERIAQTFEWEGMPGERRHRGARGPRRPRDGMLEAGMEAGLQEWYDRLDEVLERLGNPCRGCPRLRGRRPDQLTAGRARVRPRRAARARVGSG